MTAKFGDYQKKYLKKKIIKVPAADPYRLKLNHS
jgi:hypothetical protein